jgi:hypothetical protein
VTADPDLVDEFFDELGRRGHDPLLDRLDGIGRFEVLTDGKADFWTVTVKDGCPTVSHGDVETDADWLLRADREVFNQLITGEVGSLAATLNGRLDFLPTDPSKRFGLITRLFAGPPEARGRRVRREDREAAMRR